MNSRSTQQRLPNKKIRKSDTPLSVLPSEESLKAGTPEITQGSFILRDHSLPKRAAIGYYLKRLMDVLGAIVGLLIMLPVFFVIAVLIKLDSRGSIVFKQTRIGKEGKPFTFYKFRSMFVDNDNTIHQRYVTQLIRGDSELKGNNGSFKIERDPRVTRVGRILRRTSLDELPQLFNVLKGEMSLVGPRPPLPYEVALYSSHHKLRLAVLPGISGWWQVNGRTEKNFDETVELDLFYIRNWSLWLDIKILWLTISTVLNRKGAW